MKPDSQLFDFRGCKVRVVGTEDSPEFVAKDVYRILGYKAYRDAMSLLDPDERVSRKVDTLGGPQTVTCVTESGLYALIAGSRKPAAREFRKWVTGEVLPAIRKTGAYAIAPQPVVREYVRVALPQAPSTELAVGKILVGVLGAGERSRIVTAVDFARSAAFSGELANLCSDARNALHVDRLRRFLADFANKWVPTWEPQTWWVCMVPQGRKPHRRYLVTVREQEKFPTVTEHEPWSPWQPRYLTPPSLRGGISPTG